MKTVKLSLMQISCADGGGYSEDHVAYIDCSTNEAENVALHLSKEKKWPHYYRKKLINIPYFESVAEFMEQTSEKYKKEQLKRKLEDDLAKLQKELAKLQQELDGLK